MKIKRVTVKKNERGLLLRNADFERVLQPGAHWLFAGLDTLRVELFALEQPAFTHGLADYLMAKEPEVVAAEFVRVELTENQVGRPQFNAIARRDAEHQVEQVGRRLRGMMSWIDTEF